MKLSSLLILLLVASFVSTGCAKRRAAPVPTQSAGEDSLDFLDSFEEDELFAMDSDFLFADEEDDLYVSSSSASPNIASGGELAQGISGSTYTVQSGDTLMWIAYKVYGDYNKWPTLARQNGLSSGAALQTGATLSLDPNMVRELPRIAGRPYTIQAGDSLSQISMNQYGTYRQWEPLWRHNNHMIKDPNVIFAGFQLYLLPDNQLALNQ